MLDDENKRVDKLEIDIVTTGDSTLARLYGRIDIDSSPTLRDRFLGLLESPHAKDVRIDFSAVTHIDSSGMATLIEALRMARSRETKLRLQGLKGRLLQLFQLTGILSLFNGTRPNTIFGSRVV